MKARTRKVRDLIPGDRIMARGMYHKGPSTVTHVNICQMPCRYEDGGEGSVETALITFSLGPVIDMHPDAFVTLY